MVVVMVLMIAANIKASETISQADAVPYSAISWFLSLLFLGVFGWWAADLKRSQARVEWVVLQLVTLHNIEHPENKVEVWGEK